MRAKSRLARVEIEEAELPPVDGVKGGTGGRQRSHGKAVVAGGAVALWAVRCYPVAERAGKLSMGRFS